MHTAHPTAALLSGVLMLKHLKEAEAARRLEHAVVEVIREGRAVTPDLGGTARTEYFTDAVIARL